MSGEMLFIGLFLIWMVLAVTTALVCAACIREKRAGKSRLSQPPLLGESALFERETLFRILLSGHQALLEGDNFNQMASALGKHASIAMLKSRWKVDNQHSLENYLANSLDSMGTPSQDEADVLQNEFKATSKPRLYGLLNKICGNLIDSACIANSSELSPIHFQMLAHDAQDRANVIRLSLAAGYIDEVSATNELSKIEFKVVAAYDSWQQYSLSALIGYSVRQCVDGNPMHPYQRMGAAHCAFCKLAPIMPPFEQHRTCAQ